MFLRKKWRIKVGLLGLLILIPSLFGMVWVTGLLLPLFFWVVLKITKRSSSTMKIIRGFLSVLNVLILVIGARLFVFEFYAIPTSSMEKTIIPGDIIIVNKLKYGPRLPENFLEVPLVNLFYIFKSASAETTETTNWGFERLGGYGDIENGDIVVFDHPEKDQVFVKRCIGLPGDTLEIIEGTIFINGDAYDENPNILMPYRIMARSQEKVQSILNEFGIDGKRVSMNHLEALITIEEYKALSSSSEVYYLAPLMIPKAFDNYIFPYKDSRFWGQWSIDNYGPYIIPKAGMDIPLNVKTLNHYEKLINEREGNVSAMEVHDKSFSINGDQVSEYTFKHDYFFMIGDNRHDSNDSRYWGPIQEDLIIGTTKNLLISSSDNGNIRWDRFIKRLK